MGLDKIGLDQDYWNEGYDAYLDGMSGNPPQDVTDAGENAVDSWFDGWNSAQNGEEDDESW